MRKEKGVSQTKNGERAKREWGGGSQKKGGKMGKGKRKFTETRLPLLNHTSLEARRGAVEATLDRIQTLAFHTDLRDPGLLVRLVTGGSSQASCWTSSQGIYGRAKKLKQSSNHFRERLLTNWRPKVTSHYKDRF